MHIARTLPELRAALANARAPAFVPTMGNLHEGHMALVARARELGDCTVASIFVNRLQFLPHEDFDNYPRTWERDCEQLRAGGCDVLFAPDEATLYPQPQRFKVQPDPAMADILEGAFRPGFFTGVCTVVLKLFALVQPRTACFGLKDFQQQLVVRRMVEQLALPVEIVAVGTTRAADGLALSSRNGYLSVAERAEAVALSQALATMARAAHGGRRDFAAIDVEAIRALNARGWQTDYLALRRSADLAPPQEDDVPGALIALGAARLGRTRLIDNLPLAASAQA